MPQRIGEYRDRIIIQQRTETRDAAGEAIRSWSQFAIRWAKRRPLSGPEKFDAGTAVQSENLAEFRTHLTRGVDARMRILVPGVSTKTASATTVVNDDFTGATASAVWATSTGWSVSTGGALQFVATASGAYLSLGPTGLTATGNTYRSVLAISGWTEGRLVLALGPNTSSLQATDLVDGTLRTTWSDIRNNGAPQGALRWFTDKSTGAFFDGQVDSVKLYHLGTPTATTVSVDSADGFPTHGSYRIRRGDEIMLVTGGQATTTWEVSRGLDGTTAAVATKGTNVQLVQIYDIEGVDVDWHRGVETIMRGRLYDGVN